MTKKNILQAQHIFICDQHEMAQEGLGGGS